MKRALIYLIILTTATTTVYSRTKELTLYTTKTTKDIQKYRLLPKVEELIDANAILLYEKVIQALPEDYDRKQVDKWLNVPLDKLPHQQVQSTLQQFKTAIKLLEKAAKCKQCNWPYLEEDEMHILSKNLRKYRNLVFLLELQARLQIAQRQYDKALCTIQTGLAMAKHLGDSPILIQGMVGVAIGARMLRSIEQFVQGPDAPNLYWALSDIPKPFIDLTDQTMLEQPETRKKVNLLIKRLERHLAALQCIEAIRIYAGAHEGNLPSKLNKIQEVTVPNDPVTNEQFKYNIKDSKATLSGAQPESGTERDSIQYELTARK